MDLLKSGAAVWDKRRHDLRSPIIRDGDSGRIVCHVDLWMRLPQDAVVAYCFRPQNVIYYGQVRRPGWVCNAGGRPGGLGRAWHHPGLRLG